MTTCCACGCGVAVVPPRRWKKGHNHNTPIMRGDANPMRRPEVAARQKIRAAEAGRLRRGKKIRLSDEERKRRSDFQRDRNLHDAEFGKRRLARLQSKEVGEKISIHHKKMYAEMSPERFKEWFTNKANGGRRWWRSGLPVVEERRRAAAAKMRESIKRGIS